MVSLKVFSLDKKETPLNKLEEYNSDEFIKIEKMLNNLGIKIGSKEKVTLVLCVSWSRFCKDYLKTLPSTFQEEKIYYINMDNKKDDLKSFIAHKLKYKSIFVHDKDYALGNYFNIQKVPYIIRINNGVITKNNL